MTESNVTVVNEGGMLFTLYWDDDGESVANLSDPKKPIISCRWPDGNYVEVKSGDPHIEICLREVQNFRRRKKS